MDSHINLQNLRWPFNSRFSVPTVLGTPTSLSVGSTVLTSFRGNITQAMQTIEIFRTHKIDIRFVLLLNSKTKNYYNLNVPPSPLAAIQHLRRWPAKATTRF